MLAFAFLLCLWTDNHGLRVHVHVSGNHYTLRHEVMHGDGWKNADGAVHVVWHMDGMPAARAVYRLEGSQLVGWHDGLANAGRTERHWMVRKQR